MINEGLMLAVASAETLVNKALDYDPASQAAVRKLSGKVLALEITQPELRVWACFLDHGIDLRTHCEQPADCTVSGQLVDLLALAREDRFTLAGSGVNVKGETSLLQTLKQIASQVDIDWEDWLASLVGDELAHPLAQGARKLHRYAGRQWAQTREQVEPWLAEELALLATKPSLKQFNRDVQALAQAADRLEARLQALLNTRPGR